MCQCVLVLVFERATRGNAVDDTLEVVEGTIDTLVCRQSKLVL